MKFKLVFILLFLSLSIFANPVLVLNKNVIDFKKFFANIEQKKELFITNKGKSNLIIKSIRTTCGCSKIHVSKKNITPNETVILSVGLGKNSITGSFLKSIFIETNDLKQRFYKVEMRGKAISLYKIEPKNNAYISNVSKKDGFSKTFFIKFNQTINKINFGQIKLSGLNSKVKTNINQKKNTLIITVNSPEKLLTGYFNSIIEIPILKPENWPNIKLTISGKVKD